MKETFLLIDNGILDTCFTNSVENAELIFKRDKHYIFSDTTIVISEADYRNELLLNSLESKSAEEYIF